MAKFTNEKTGVTVSVRDGKRLGRGWVPAESKAAPAPVRRTAKKPDEK